MKCKQCRDEVDPLAVFPGNLCFTCWEPIGNAKAATMTADDLAVMWGAPRRRVRRPVARRR